MKVSVEIQRALQSLRSTAIVDGGAYGHLVHHFTLHRLPLHALQLHARIVLFSVTPDNFLASRLINFYTRQNRFRQAHHVFDEIPVRNAFSYNALLIAYTSREMHSDAVSLFSSWIASYCYSSGAARPDGVSISNVLKAMSGYDGCWFDSLAREVHCYVLRGGFDSDVFVGNGLVTYYAKCGQVASARRVFDGMPERDVVSWNSMISGYSQSGFHEECKELYKTMLTCPGLRPNGVTAISVIQSCGHSNDLVFGMEVHKQILENFIQMDLSLCNAVVGFYAKCGSLDYARALFDAVGDKDSVTYGAMISGYMAHGFIREAMTLFRETESIGLSTWNSVISGLMQNNQPEEVVSLFREMIKCGFRPNAVTLSSILPSFSYNSNLTGGKEIHAFAIRNGCGGNIYVATAVIDNYAKLGFLQGSQRVFNNCKDRSLIVWTAIISAYAVHGDSEAACNLFYQMQSHGIKPDNVTLTTVLSACAHSGEVDKARNIFDSMSVSYGIEPGIEHYACMVSALSRAGKLSEAVEFILKMPIEPSAKVWGALLNGASVLGDVEIARFACDRLFEIEPENTGNYVIMANLYTQTGKWEEAEMVRDKMKGTGLKKIAGSSWIETGKGLRSFIAKDISCERSKEMCTVLEGLVEAMRDRGYVMRQEETYDA
ncbi:PREDICTED: pentatricopeptide repeat-containing protein At2g37310 [Tarenaya hassleriana]|uniref:pentatricopeptide repeat-containing protein At2g37310 n=1 Tax=Tarenaya hassleriana TaxID=28532 RepID=UPI00053C46C0|nr:PREDICTED: pentatricopeptide repeat-containing protein At2g37310 [Tarenaya hassleriana]